MKSPLRVLLVEDNPRDAELIRWTLEAEEIVCDPVRVQTRGDFVGALEQQTFDLILSDHTLPSFDGLSALAIAREKCPETPFIFVSGTMGEELAVETLKKGATDYVLKHRLVRLASSVRRAIDEFTERAARQRAERAWREAEALFRSVFESTAVGIAVLNLERRVIQTNCAFQRMLAYGENELGTMKFTEFTHPDDVAVDARLFEELVVGKRASYQIEKRFLRKDESPVWGRLTISLIHDDVHQPEFAVALVEDISERKILEAKLLESQKMEAVGRLAAGIAHDFNNVLTVISGYSGLLLAQLPEGAPFRREIYEISAASERATALTKRLLAFGRQQAHQPKVLGLNSVVTGLEHMLRRLVGDKIRLETLFDRKSGYVEVDEIQIEQLLMNLVINARDAMPAGGDLTIATGNVRLEGQFTTTHGIEPGEYVMLAVTDTGHGMDEATKSRIFEPFYTTKEVGKGTGLGLWTVREVVRQAQGAIDVDSRLDHGTTFRIFLPCVPRKADLQDPDEGSTPATSAEEVRSLREDSPRRVTVLVADDDPAIRILIRHILQDSGCRVLEAAHGRQAIDQLHQEDVDLLITDLLMPEQEGIETIRAVKKEFPHLRIVAMSGGYGQQFLRVAQFLGADSVIRKPFETDLIRETVRHLLANPIEA